MPTPGFNLSLIVIITTLLFRSSLQTACGTGWFGNGCKYKCWCRSNKCQRNGACLRGIPCVSGWFGPSCQFRKRMLFTESQQSWIQDEQIETCNPGTQIISGIFDDSYYFTWLRIVYSGTAPSLEEPGAVYFYFNDISNKSVDCLFKSVFVVNPMTVDIHCNMSTRVNQITLRGNDSLRICELFVNGGKNLALKERTNQSPVALGSQDLYSSRFAVDGSRISDLDNKTCSHTEFGDTNPTWFLYYSRPVIIDIVVLINRDVLQEQLRGFTIKMFDVNGTQVQYYKEPGLIKAEYRVSFWNLKPVHMMSVQATSVLTLCEVETYGERVCPRFKWGLDCLEDCWCQPTELCSPITGKCDKGCTPGFYGLLCEKKCPMNCFNALCFRDTGACIQCKQGYKGDICDIECLPNKYGTDCLMTCHSSCRKRSCKKNANESDTDSDCSDRLCDLDGLCYVCRDTARYGLHCTLECPNSCQFQRCDSKDGSCYSCQTGFYGKACSQICANVCKDGCELRSGVCYECRSTFYGENCSLRCPITCTEQTCHPKHGTCLERCAKGFHGPTCSNKCPKMCKNKMCEVTNGSCIQGCETGVFGATCSDICPRRCRNRICDFSNGSCYACDISFYGVRCDLRCSEECIDHTCKFHTGACSLGERTDYPTTVFAPIVAVSVLLLLVMGLLWKRKDESGSYEEGESSFEGEHTINGSSGLKWSFQQQ